MNQIKNILLFALVILSFKTSNAQWINANPGAGGQLQHVVCDPNITGRMYLCSDMEGYYVSHDFGDHWIYKGWEAPFSNVFNIAVEPGNSQRLYLTSTQGLAISDNAGDSWEVVSRFKNVSIATLSVNPNNTNMVCLAKSWLEETTGSHKGAGTIHFTLDKGKTWKQSTFINFSNNINVYSILFHPNEEVKDVLVANDDGIFVSTDELKNWQKLVPPENTKACQGIDFTPDGNWLYAIFIRNDNNTGIYVKKYDGGNWQELDANGFLQKLNQTHWRPKVWPGSDERTHYVLFGTLNRGGNYNDNGLNEGRFIVEEDKVYGHVNQILKVQGENEPFDVGWNAYWSHCRTYDYYPESWDVEGISRGVFTMCQQSTFRGDAAKPGEWVVNTCHHVETKNQTKFYRTNGTASTWVWDVAGIANYVAMGMGDNGIIESWDNGFSWTQKYAPGLWNVDALEVVKGEKTIVLAGRTNGFGGALNEKKGRLYYRELDINNPGGTWKYTIDGTGFGELKGLDPSLNRIATIQSDPHNPERVYLGTNDGLYVTENIFELINGNSQYYFKSISKPVIGSTLTRRIHVDPNNPNILFLRCWKGTYRIEKHENGNYSFFKLKVNGSDANLNDGWGHNGDMTVWKFDTTTCLMLTRNMSAGRELWLSFDKGENFTRILNKAEAFDIRAPENNWYTNQGPIRFGGLCGIDSLLFTSVHLRGGGEGLTKGISFLKGTIQKDSSIVWEDYTGDPRNGGNWFPANRGGKIWKDGSGNPAIHVASMGAGMWKRSLVESNHAQAMFTSDLSRGNLPLNVKFDASNSLPGENASTIVSYEWDFGDGKKGTGEKISHKYSQNKVFNVKLKVSDDKGNTGYAYQKIEGKIYFPVADFVVSTYEGKTNNEIQFFGELSYDENPNEMLVTYLWDFGDGNSGSGKNVSHIYTKAGSYNVKLTVRNKAFRSSSAYKKVQIELNTNTSFQHQGIETKIYPNPFDEKLFIETSNQIKSEITVLNILGRQQFQKKTNGNYGIDTKSWLPGIYLVSIKNKDKRFSYKLLKK